MSPVPRPAGIIRFGNAENKLILFSAHMHTAPHTHTSVHVHTLCVLDYVNESLTFPLKCTEWGWRRLSAEINRVQMEDMRTCKTSHLIKCDLLRQSYWFCFFPFWYSFWEMQDCLYLHPRWLSSVHLMSSWTLSYLHLLFFSGHLVFCCNSFDWYFKINSLVNL